MLLLPTHTASRARPTPVEDDHGWVLPDSTGDPLVFACSLQEADGPVYVTASDGGGAGPYAPRGTRAGYVYCDPGTDVQAGDVLTINGTPWQARTVVEFLDPAGTTAACLRVGVET